VDNFCSSNWRAWYLSVGNQSFEAKEVSSMRHVYDIFEKFPDASTLWRASVVGRFEANRRMQELAEYSRNEFFLIAVPAADFPPPAPAPKSSRLLSQSTAGGD
jgi:hypothetical protein